MLLGSETPRLVQVQLMPERLHEYYSDKRLWLPNTCFCCIAYKQAGSKASTKYVQGE